MKNRSHVKLLNPVLEERLIFTSKFQHSNTDLSFRPKSTHFRHAESHAMFLDCPMKKLLFSL